MASQQARDRAKAILLTLTGTWEVTEALAYLGVGRTRFAQLRRQLLEGALGALESGPTGRPPRARSGEEEALEALRLRVGDLEHRLVCARTELELLRGPAREAVLEHQGGGR